MNRWWNILVLCFSKVLRPSDLDWLQRLEHSKFHETFRFNCSCLLLSWMRAKHLPKGEAAPAWAPAFRNVTGTPELFRRISSMIQERGFLCFPACLRVDESSCSSYIYSCSVLLAFCRAAAARLSQVQARRLPPTELKARITSWRQLHASSPWELFSASYFYSWEIRNPDWGPPCSAASLLTN